MANWPPGKGTLRYRLLNQKTGWQKALVAVTAVATAILAIGGVVALVLPLFRASPEVGASATPVPTPAASRVDGAAPAAGLTTADGGITVIRTQTAEADALVKSLIATAGKAPVLLNHQIFGKPGPVNVTLYYGCGQTGSCSMTRIEVANDAGRDVLAGDAGVWLKGCFAVGLDGFGYGAEHLDIELRKVGDACPT